MLDNFIEGFIAALIALVVFISFLFAYLTGSWQDYKEERYADDREAIKQEVLAAQDNRRLDDLAQLRNRYLARCPLNKGVTVLEGDSKAICEAFAKVLIAQSQTRGMTLATYGHLEQRLCLLEAEYFDEVPEQYCSWRKPIDTASSDALSIALCELDRARVYDPHNQNQLSKRGPTVYTDSRRRVDCNSGLIREYDYEGFFTGLSDEEEDWPSIVNQIYQLIEEGDHDAALALVENHDFGKEEQTDQWILNAFLGDHLLTQLPRVLELNGGRVNFDTEYYSQPLTLAIKEDAPNTALALLEAGANPIHPGNYGKTPIVGAAEKGMLAVVIELVNRGADVNGVLGSESLDFGEPLFWASWAGHEEVAQWLLENGAAISPNDLSNFPNWSSDELLEHAVIGGDLDVVEKLVQLGATSTNSEKLIKRAIKGGNPDVLKLIFRQGHKLPEVARHDNVYRALLKIFGEKGDGHIENAVLMYEFLLEQGLDMSHQSESGSNYAYQAIVYHAASPIQPHTDSKARGELVRAQRNRFVKRVIKEVLATGVSIDQRYESDTLLMAAASKGQVELINYLLELGADPGIKNDQGQTALDIAIVKGRRLSNFWGDKASVRRNFSEAIIALGGDPAMLDAVAQEKKTSKRRQI